MQHTHISASSDNHSSESSSLFHLLTMITVPSDWLHAAWWRPWVTRAPRARVRWHWCQSFHLHRHVLQPPSSFLWVSGPIMRHPPNLKYTPTHFFLFVQVGMNFLPLFPFRCLPFLSLSLSEFHELSDIFWKQVAIRYTKKISIKLEKSFANWSHTTPVFNKSALYSLIPSWHARFGM